MARQLVQDFKSSLWLNGSGQYVNIPNNAKFNLGTFSFSFWVKRLAPPPVTFARLIDKRQGSGNTGWSFLLNTGGTSEGNTTPYFEVRTSASGSVAAIGTYLPKGVWRHYIASFDGTNVTLFENGVQTATTVFGATYNTSTAAIMINSDTTGAGTKYGNFQLENLRFHANSSTAAQALEIYSGSAIASDVGIYLAGEGAGTTLFDTGSGTAVNGTITAATYVADVTSLKRQPVGANLVRNGDFEYAPPFTAATSTTARWIDGTAAGSTTNNLFNVSYAINTGTGSGQFDTAITTKGAYSVRVDATAGSSTKLVIGSPTTGGSLTLAQLATATAVQPNTSYTLVYTLKSSNVGTTANVTINLHNATGTRTTVGTASNSQTGTVAATTYTETFTTGSTDAYVIFVALNSNVGGGSTSTLWIDNIILTPTVNPTSRPVVQDFKASLSFNGTSSGVVGMSTTARTAGQPIVLGAHIKVAAYLGAGVEAVIGIRTGSGAGGVSRLGFETNGAASFDYDTTGSGAKVITTAIVPKHEWCTLVGVYDGTYIKVYLNGKLVGTSASLPSAALSTTALGLGKRTDSAAEWFNGLMAMAFVSYDAWTDADVMSWHLSKVAPVGKTISKLVGSSRVDLQACKLEYSIVSPK